jgi:hypothetical protein
MANPEHVEILEQGVEDWNKWRIGATYTFPHLSNRQWVQVDTSTNVDPSALP